MKRIKCLFLLLIVIVFSSCSKTNEINIYEKTINSIVEVKKTEGDSDSFGTAICINEDGDFITNYHVIKRNNANTDISYQICIRYSFEEDYRIADVIKFDVENDMALIHVDDNIHKKIKFCNLSKIKNGDTVYALGNSQNQGITMTKGIISNYRVNVKVDNYIRTTIVSDSFICEGNSGGALLNTNAELVGMTSFRLKDEYGNIIEGLTYSIPIDIIIEFIN
ncbi:MAG: serine protease [Acholeplasmatales bacterium]|nr:serine protease [Acholeplasmatales bacterium]